MTPLQAYLNSPRARRALSKKPGEEGFSLIELVVVVSVLGILSAIAIPSFLCLTKKAKATVALSSLKSIRKECLIVIFRLMLVHSYSGPGARSPGYQPVSRT